MKSRRLFSTRAGPWRPGRRFRAVFAPSLVALGSLLVPSCAGPPPLPEPTERRLRVGAWLAYWKYEEGIRAATFNAGTLDDIFFFVAHLGSDGRPRLALSRPGLPRDVARLSGNARAWLTVVNDVEGGGGERARLKDPEIVHEILDSPTRRAEHRRQIVALARENGFAGVDIDYENLWARDRAAFTRFIQELAADLRPAGLSLSVTVQPKVRERLSRGAGAMDWAALSAAADRLQIMLYNLHYRASGPGPISTPLWIREVLTFAASRCDAGKIVPVLKVSGMDWWEGNARNVTFTQALSLARRHGAHLERQSGSEVPHFDYTTGGVAHSVFFEDATSILAKLEVFPAFAIDRVVLWSLGGEDPTLLPRIRELKSGRSR